MVVKTYQRFVELINSILPADEVNTWGAEWAEHLYHLNGETEYPDSKVQDLVKALAVRPIEEALESPNS